MKTCVISILFFTSFTSCLSQDIIDFETSEKMFKEMCMEYYDDSTYYILFDYHKVDTYGLNNDRWFYGKFQDILFKKFGRKNLIIKKPGFTIVVAKRGLINTEILNEIELEKNYKVKDVTQYVGLCKRRSYGGKYTPNGIILYSGFFTNDNIFYSEKWLYDDKRKTIKLIKSVISPTSKIFKD